MSFPANSLLSPVMDFTRPESVADFSLTTSPTSVLSVPESVAPIDYITEESQTLLPEEISRNVTLLTCESTAANGLCNVFIFGTAHISQDSCVQVRELIDLLKPEVVFLELCTDRLPMLSPQYLKVPTVREMIVMLKEKHNLFEILYGWYLAKIADRLNVFPGAEFRAAYEEAMKYGGRVILGDRPVQITLWRAWTKMPLWHKTKFVCSLLFSGVSLPSHDEMDKMLKETDDSDMITFLIEEMGKEFPTLVETLVYERDKYMCSKLLKVARESNSVVAVVGKGHVQGMKKHWEQPIMVSDLLTIPSPKQISAVRSVVSIGVAIVMVAIISGIYLSSKK